MTKHCGDTAPHAPHTWYEPSKKPGETKQTEYQCPGTKERKS